MPRPACCLFLIWMLPKIVSKDFSQKSRIRWSIWLAKFTLRNDITGLQIYISKKHNVNSFCFTQLSLHRYIRTNCTHACMYMCNKVLYREILCMVLFQVWIVSSCAKLSYPLLPPFFSSSSSSSSPSPLFTCLSLPLLLLSFSFIFLSFSSSSSYSSSFSII